MIEPKKSVVAVKNKDGVIVGFHVPNNPPVLIEVDGKLKPFNMQSWKSRLHDLKI